MASTSGISNSLVNYGNPNTQSYLALACRQMNYQPVRNRVTVITRSSPSSTEFDQSAIVQMIPWRNLDLTNSLTTDSLRNMLCSAVDRALLAVKNRSKVRISVTNTNNKLLTNTQAAEVILIQILKFLLDHSDSTLEVAVRTGENLYEVYNDVHCQIKRQIVSQQIEIKAYSSDSGQASKTDQLEGYFEILKHIDVGVCKFEISSTSQEYCKIFEQLYPYFKNWSQLFLRHRFTYKISKIQNLILLAQYEAQKRKVEWLLAAEQSTFPAERKLLHATSKTAADKICEEEFNRNFSDSVYGTSLGAGTYFDTEAVVAKYGNKCFFVARVLTGKYYQDNRSVSRVNLLPTYHSTVDNVDNPNIFVVYHDAAAYPEYLIEFTY